MRFIRGKKKISINKKTTKNIKILKNEIYAMKKTRFHYNKKKNTKNNMLAHTYNKYCG
jgi:ribosomal protein L32